MPRKNQYHGELRYNSAHTLQTKTVAVKQKKEPFELTNSSYMARVNLVLFILLMAPATRSKARKMTFFLNIKSKDAYFGTKG